MSCQDNHSNLPFQMFLFHSYNVLLSNIYTFYLLSLSFLSYLSSFIFLLHSLFVLLHRLFSTFVQITSIHFLSFQIVVVLWKLIELFCPRNWRTVGSANMCDDSMIHCVSFRRDRPSTLLHIVPSLSLIHI